MPGGTASRSDQEHEIYPPRRDLKIAHADNAQASDFGPQERPPPAGLLRILPIFL
jgi:hypothetical protein